MGVSGGWIRFLKEQCFLWEIWGQTAISEVLVGFQDESDNCSNSGSCSCQRDKAKTPMAKGRFSYVKSLHYRVQLLLSPENLYVCAGFRERVLCVRFCECKKVKLVYTYWGVFPKIAF